jgi:two-component system chemotaxis response regulator CheY
MQRTGLKSPASRSSPPGVALVRWLSRHGRGTHAALPITLPSLSPGSGTPRSEWPLLQIRVSVRTQPKVLLVDDEELVRQLLARILDDAGYAVEEADNGASGLQAARRLDGSLSLVITDINMPVMDGLEFARMLRRTDTRVPFLFITALDPALINEIGAPAQVLAKPFTPDAFLAAVNRIVSGVSKSGSAGVGSEP